ncbi:MAG TPA: hypothetical protein VE641_14245, partial [Chthoniobacterales bacterium]|nr:hypothetical protein [Chthoniobacterales bacterium]
QRDIVYNEVDLLVEPGRIKNPMRTPFMEPEGKPGLIWLLDTFSAFLFPTADDVFIRDLALLDLREYRDLSRMAFSGPGSQVFGVECARTAQKGVILRKNQPVRSMRNI